MTEELRTQNVSNSLAGGYFSFPVCDSKGELTGRAITVVDGSQRTSCSAPLRSARMGRSRQYYRASGSTALSGVFEVHVEHGCLVCTLLGGRKICVEFRVAGSSMNM